MGFFDGLAGGILSGVGSIIQGSQQVKSVKQQNKGQIALADKAFAQNKEMWNLQNQYNSPEMQMARLKSAGLNPNLVYGSGAVGNTSGSTPTYQAPNLQRVPREQVNPLNALGAYLDLKQKSAMADQARIAANYSEVKSKADIAKTLYNNKMLSDIMGVEITPKLKGRYGTVSAGEPNMYLQKYQLDMGRTLRDNQLKDFQIEFMKNIPKSMQWMTPLFINLLKTAM